jgi:hypothetical protein
MEWAIAMATLRTHIVLPAELANEIDELVGPRGRSAFLVETAAKEIKRRKLLAFLNSDEPAWRDENHPELVEMGTAVRLAGRDENLDPL